MAKYMILIFGDEQQWDAMSPEEQQQIDQGHRTFHAKAGANINSSGQLNGPGMATTLRRDSGGQLTITDGPFLETKEALGGYYVLEANDLDEVIGLAGGLAEVGGGHSWVEIHPLVDHG